MKWDEFLHGVRRFPLLDKAALGALPGNKRTLSNLMTRWARQGKLFKLRRGLYMLPEGRHAGPIPSPVLAQALYFPSYISLESALSHYELIPEKVEEWTSVTAKKTAQFNNPLGRFTYAHVKPGRFFGYEKIQEGPWSYLMAWPEKALLDWIYLDNRKVKKPLDYVEILRLQNLDHLSPRRLMECARRFDSRKVSHAAAAMGPELKKWP